MKIKEIIITLLVVALCPMLTLSCASPEKDGSALGKNVNECNKEYLEVLQKLDVNFGKNASYNSRATAKSAYFTAKAEANNNYSIALYEIYQTASDKKKSYGNHKSQSEFNTAFVNAIDSDLSNSVRSAFANTKLPSTVLLCIKSIIPPKPSIKQIQQDLIGHSLSEGVNNGYYPSSWRWVIAEKEISDFHIINTLSETQTEYLFIAKMRLTSEVGKAFDATVKIRYILPDDDDWTIDFIQSQGLYIIKTGYYGDCIKSHVYFGAFSWSFCLENNCERALEVGGKVLENGTWKKFSVVVGSHDTSSVGWVVEDGYIDYVERP